MLKFDMESKGARDVPQVDQPDLYLPSESELQMAQVGFAVGNPVKQIDVLLFLPFLQCVYFSTESWNCKTDCWSQRIETKQRRPQTKGTDRFQIVSYFVWLPHIVILTKSVGFVVVINKVTHCPIKSTPDRMWCDALEHDCERTVSLLLENPPGKGERDCSQSSVKPLYNDHFGAELKEPGHGLRILESLAYICEVRRL